MTHWLGWFGGCLKWWFVNFWRKWFHCLTDLLWCSPGRLRAVRQIFLWRTERSIFSLRALPCASQTTSQTQDAHLFLSGSLCSLAMRDNGVWWLSKIAHKRTCTRVRTDAFPRSLNSPSLADHLPTFLPLARASEPLRSLWLTSSLPLQYVLHRTAGDPHLAVHVKHANPICYPLNADISRA